VIITELADKYRDLKRNKGATDFVFKIEDITKTRRENGFSIAGFGLSRLNDMLLKFQQESRFIKVFQDKRMFCLTPEGIQHCQELNLGID